MHKKWNWRRISIPNRQYVKASREKYINILNFSIWHGISKYKFNKLTIEYRKKDIIFKKFKKTLQYYPILLQEYYQYINVCQLILDIYIYVCIYMFKYTHMFLLCVYICAYMYVCVYMHIYVYIMVNIATLI